jgi:glycosyltransferase involved in cell wall biosynthesis
MSNQPSICSVIITCFNDGLYLEEAIQSVLDSSTKCDLIIVDDCSTDSQTITLLQTLTSKYNIICLEENKGVGNARNIGFNAAKTKYILPLDADDILEKDFIKNAIKLMEEESEISVVYGNIEKFGKENRVIIVPEFNGSSLLGGNYIANSSLIKNEAFKCTNGYDTCLPNYEDWDMWITLLENGAQFKKLNQVAFLYRIKDTSKISKCLDPEHRKKVVAQICNKHQSLYQQNAQLIVPYLHQTITSLEKRIKMITSLDEKKGVEEMSEKIELLENQLREQKKYYEGSVFWKLKLLFTNKK